MHLRARSADKTPGAARAWSLTTDTSQYQPGESWWRSLPLGLDEAPITDCRHCKSSAWRTACPVVVSGGSFSPLSVITPNDIILRPNDLHNLQRRDAGSSGDHFRCVGSASDNCNRPYRRAGCAHKLERGADEGKAIHLGGRQFAEPQVFDNVDAVLG